MYVPAVLFESGFPTLLEQTAAAVGTLAHEARDSWFSIAHEASLQLPAKCSFDITVSLEMEIVYADQLSLEYIQSL